MTWAHTFCCYPERYLQPRSDGELARLVRLAHRCGKKLMTVGSGHSPSDITMTNDWIVNLDRYADVLNIDQHAKYADVRVQAGIRIYQLTAELKKHGLMIQSLGSIADQSIAGAISTGTHGSSAFHGLISQQIVDLTVLLANGEYVTCSQTDRPDLFAAALLSLGKIGIISHVTIRVVPEFKLESIQEVISFDTLLLIWPTIWTEHEFVRIWWFPYSRKCVIWRADKTDKQITPSRYSWYGSYFGRLFYECLLWLCVKVRGSWTPGVERFVFSRQYGVHETFGRSKERVTEYGTDAFRLDCLFKQVVNEWALPMENGTEALLALDAAIDEASSRGQYYVHAPIEVRVGNTTVPSPEQYTEMGTPLYPSFVHPHRGVIPGNTIRPLLDLTPELEFSPSPINRNLCLYLNATMYRPFGNACTFGAWFREFEAITGKLGGRPHWAKNFIGEFDETVRSKEDGHMYGFSSTISRWLGSNLTKWKQIRREVDPDNLFLSGEQWADRNGLVD
ncbi:hypothetical protein CANCADRAFT_57079 [Tortispora caseinolytica NRRL Y-17796]|uniref:D-arabinono-1,4-lactone oxidase n=1 Tax=Tortispora caseinolytica NRRL Y-17796 TaxID=767744 RepID=A0A1E4TFX5_9ASCO|nr:hypothetical protein CANCADRAFT_57079 [Tortispora caseinolytica NRRL Y-17796]